jgi:rubrerythrin
MTARTESLVTEALAAVLALAFIALGIFISFRRRKMARRARAGLNLCPKCNYDRAGLAKDVVCPECGSAAS